MSETKRGDSARLRESLLILALRKIQKRGGKMNVADLNAALEKDGNIPSWAQEKYSGGQSKWLAGVRFMSVQAGKAMVLRKKSGNWILTPEGEKSMKLVDEDLLAKIKEGGREWDAKKRSQTPLSLGKGEGDAGVVDDAETASDVDYAAEMLQQREAEARNSIRDRIKDFDAYEFQDLVAALLRGMGYYVRDNAAPGPDGGIDIFAYTDPLGARGTRLKVQVKHRVKVKRREVPASVKELRELKGLLNEGEIGVFVSSSGFSAPGKKFAATTDKHIELIDMDRFIDLWRESHDKMSDEDRALLPLKRIAFYASKAGV